MFDFSHLSDSKMKVVFIKKDGTIRVMICTTDMNSIPLEKHPTGKGLQHESNQNIKKVYDLEKNAWRSFRIDSVISAKVI